MEDNLNSEGKSDNHTRKYLEVVQTSADNDDTTLVTGNDKWVACRVKISIEILKSLKSRKIKNSI